MDSTTEFKIKALEAERKKLTTYTASKDPKNAKRVDAINKEMSALIKMLKDDNAPKNALANPPEASGYNGAPINAMNAQPAPASGYGLQSTKGLDMGDQEALTAEANQLRATIREFQDSPEVTGRAQERLDAIMNYLAEPSVFPLPPQNSPAHTPLFLDNDTFNNLWDNAPVTTALDMAKAVKDPMSAGATGNNVTDPKLRAGIIKDVDTNIGDNFEKMTKTIGNTDPTIAGSGRQVGGNNQGPLSGPIEPTGQGALPAATIGSGAVGTQDAVNAAVAQAAKEGATPAMMAAVAKQTAIAYGASTDAATNIAATALMNGGVPAETAIRMASSAPASIAGSTGGPPAGFASSSPGVTSNGVTGITGQADGAGTTTASGSNLVNGGTATPTVAATPSTTNPTTPAASSGSNLVNGGTVTPVVSGGGIDPATGLIVGAGALGTVGSVLTGNAMADAQIHAAQIQADAANEATKLQKTIYDQSRNDLEPWRTAGAGALQQLQGFDAANPQFKSDPFKFDTNARSPAYNDAYNFRLSEGLKALQSSAAAKGMLRSGNTMQAITQYGQGMASQEVDNEFNRYQTNRTNDFNIFNAQRGSKLNALQSLAGVGQSAVSQMTNAGQNYANQAGQTGMTAANAQANGMTGAANDRASGWIGGIQTGMNALGMALNYGNQQTMSNAFAKYYGS